MESDSSQISEDGKRRRSDDGSEMQAFSRSKKTARSPRKKEEDKIDQMMILLQKIALDLQEVKDEQKEIRKEQKNIQQELRQLKENYEAVRKESEYARKENKEMKAQIMELEVKVERMEKENKKDNIVMVGFGKEIKEEKLLINGINDFFKTHLQVDTQIANVFKIRSDTCVVKMKNAEEKDKVMKNKHKLKSLADKVYINDDLTENERKKQAEIRKMAKAMMSEGKDVKIGYSKIMVDGIEWRWDRNKNMLQQAKN
nr:unnamed protein product [Callosobruchus analis]